MAEAAPVWPADGAVLDLRSPESLRSPFIVYAKHYDEAYWARHPYLSHIEASPTDRGDVRLVISTEGQPTDWPEENDKWDHILRRRQTRGVRPHDLELHGSGEPPVVIRWCPSVAYSMIFHEPGYEMADNVGCWMAYLWLDPDPDHRWTPDPSAETPPGETTRLSEDGLGIEILVADGSYFRVDRYRDQQRSE